MTTQEQMFPLTQLDIAEAFLVHFETEVEKTTKAMFNAQAKVAEALKLREMAEHEVRRERLIDAAGLNGPSPVDPITGEVATSTVFALYPGDDDLHETPVGDRTRYSELVADYFTAAGLSAAVDADEWTVVVRRELETMEGGGRSLHDIIAPEDYGQELLVVALDQGSVTGAAAEKVAT